MKAVMISINPKWVQKIIEGKKTIEVRKSIPKLEMPFKCYIYCTKNPVKYNEETNTYYGKVIGEFVCDNTNGFYCIDDFYYPSGGLKILTCLTNEEMVKYGKGEILYGWHISELKIYDKPKELSEFWTVKCTKNYKTCGECKDKPKCIKTITRPPQSFVYVEYKGDKL